MKGNNIRKNGKPLDGQKSLIGSNVCRSFTHEYYGANNIQPPKKLRLELSVHNV